MALVRAMVPPDRARSAPSLVENMVEQQSDLFDSEPIAEVEDQAEGLEDVAAVDGRGLTPLK